MLLRILITMTLLGLTLGCNERSKNTNGEENVTEQSAAEGAEGETAAEETTPTSTADTMGRRMDWGMMGTCPMNVQGTTMALEDTTDGIAMVFSNTTSADEVQRRAMQMAAEHPMAMDRHGSPLPAFDIMSEKTEMGARVTMVPRDPAQMQAFRDQIRELSESQAAMQCPMMMMYNREPGPKGRGMAEPSGS